MSPCKHILTAVCLLGCGLSSGVGAPVDRAASPIIGLCRQDGVSGIVLEEVLKIEGIPYLRLHDLGQLERTGLRGLILGEGFERAAPEIETFVRNGGVLLSLKPSGELAQALGLAQVGVQTDGHLTVSGQGASRICYQGRLQLIGLSNCCQGGEKLAGLDGKGDFAAITRVRHGSGTALAVAFDLAGTLLKLSQPESQCGKAVDASNVEYELGQAPQADLVRRLVVGLFLDAIDVPVMRKWYFPSQHKAMLIVLGDQDGADFAQLSAVLTVMRELHTPYTLFVTPAHQPVGREQFKILADGGMELALHPDFVSAGRNFSEPVFQADLKKAEADVGRRLTGERSHAMRWGSFRDTPCWAESAGLQYDAILGIAWWPSKPAQAGYWLGTGLPFHFIDTDHARRMDFLEIPIAGIDNQDFWKYPRYTVSYKPDAKKTFVAGLGLTEEAAFEVMKRTLDRAAEKYYAATGYCWHPHYLAAKTLKRPAPFTSDAHFRKCIDYAKRRGIGLIGANALNEFWRAREKVLVKEGVWNARLATVQYKISSPTQLAGLTFIVPLRFHGKKLRVSSDDRPVLCGETELFGAQYGMFALDVGPQERVIAVQYQ